MGAWLSRITNAARSPVLARACRAHVRGWTRTGLVANVGRQSADVSVPTGEQRAGHLLPDRESRQQPARRERKPPSPESLGRHRSFRRVLQRVVSRSRWPLRCAKRGKGRFGKRPSLSTHRSLKKTRRATEQGAAVYKPPLQGGHCPGGRNH